MKGREPLYLKPGMSEAELLAQFQARNPYYRHIANMLADIADGNQCDVGDERTWTHIIDVYGRSGYCSRAAMMMAQEVTIIENRLSFVAALEDEFAADPKVHIVPEEPVMERRGKVSLVLCCEQGAQLLKGDFGGWMKRAAGWCAEGSIFGMTLGPSNHPFQDFDINNHRVGENDPAKVMTELSHPIAQAVHAEMVRLLKSELDFKDEAVWPAAKLTNPDEIQRICRDAGWKDLLVYEEKFRIPGHKVHLFQENAWTMYFRFWTEEQCSTPKRIDLLERAIGTVRARPEYDAWCEIDAWHPVVFYIATRD